MSFLQYALSVTARCLGMLVLLSLLAWPALGQPAHPEVEELLQHIRQLSEQALEASRAAAEAQTEGDVKRYADAVFGTVWGIPSGLRTERGAANVHGWKIRWQVDGSEFDDAFAERYGTQPPPIDDPMQLGIVGTGLHLRKQLQALIDDESTDEAVRRHAGHVIASLNNVIGWMKMDDGVTKAERQPRVDLTREWDAPSEFWLSTADTGWLHEVYAQALNILKTDYEGDAATARQHAAAMATLLEKVVNGVDADEDGAVEPVMMEGGLSTVYEHAGYGGFLTP